MYRNELLSILTSGLDNPSPTVKTPALSGIVNLAHIPGFLTGDEISFVVQRINPLLVDISANNLRTEAIQALSAISLLVSKPMEESTLPMLFGKLPDSAPALDQVESRFQYLQILESLSELCVSPSLFETLVVRVLSKLDLLCEDVEKMKVDGKDDSDIQHECDVAYAFALLNCLLTTLRKKVVAKHLDVSKYFDQVVPRLFSLSLNGAKLEGAGPSIAADVRIISACAAVVEILTQTSGAERQSDFANVLIPAFRTSGVDQLASTGKHTMKILDGPQVLPFSEGASIRHQNLVILFSACIIALRGDVDAFTTNAETLLEHLVEWSLKLAPNQRLSETIAKCIFGRRTGQSILSTKELAWSGRIGRSFCGHGLPRAL